MNKLFLLLLFIFVAISLSAQEESKWPAVDASPLDVVYYPTKVAWRNYLTEEERNITPKVKLIYSRPQKKDRDIFGGLVPFDKEWRLGANEATTIAFYQAIGVGDETIPGGVYTMFADVNEDSWTVHFSSETGIWGGANRDMSKTIASVSVPVEKVSSVREELAMTFIEIDDQTCHLVVEWDQTRVRIPIHLNPIQFSNLDASPLDVAHYPAKSAYTNYLQGEEKSLTPQIQVTYSRPMKKGRNIFGELIPYDKVWRIGANEATEIAFYQDVTIGDTNIPRGRYSMFAEVQKEEWNIIFSKDFPIWGEHERDETKDFAKVSVPVNTTDEVVENLSIIYEDQDDGTVHMIVAWDNVNVAVPIKIKE